MLSKFISTWIIAAFLVGVMTLFSILSGAGSSQSADSDVAFSKYAIQADDISAQSSTSREAWIKRN